MKHTITVLTAEGEQFVAYEGPSEELALCHLDTARKSLVIANGTADIQHLQNDVITAVVVIINGTYVGLHMAGNHLEYFMRGSKQTEQWSAEVSL